MVEKFLPEQQSADEWKRQSSKVPIGRWMFGFWMVHPSKTQNGWEGVENLLARFFGVWRATRRDQIAADEAHFLDPNVFRV